MPATVEEIERFRQFALERVKASDPAPELDELMMCWYDAEEQSEIDAKIRQGLADIEAGLGRSAREVTAEISRRLGLPEE